VWSFAQLVFLTVLAAAAVIAVAGAGFSLCARCRSDRTAARIVSVAATIAVASVLSVGLHHAWGARRDSNRRVWAARDQHLHRLQLLLRAEAESLDGIGRALRQGRYFTLVANDARQAIWHDEVLTVDVQRHFPEYFHEREQLIRDILEHENERGHVREIVSASLQLTTATEPYRSQLVTALVNKCGGAAPGVSLLPVASNASPEMPGSGTDRYDHMPDAMHAYEQYRCTVDLTRMSQGLLDRGADLADAASLAGATARRHAEETVLGGACTYAPAE
jgi:hypothetical protein